MSSPRRRELAATEWTELGKIYPSPGYISEVVTIFLATGLSPASGERDEDEAIDIVRLPLAELDEALPRIRDASTLIALMALRDRLAGTASDRVSELQIFIAALLVSVALLNTIANRLRLPFPIVLVIGGLLLALVPGIPERRTEPGPRPRRLPAAAALLGRLLRRPAGAAPRHAGDRAAGDRAGAGDGRRRRRPRPRGVRPALGARPSRSARSSAPPTRSPRPRSSAASACRGGSSTILEGEALVNDATALVAYKVAVAAAVGEGFSASHAGLEFLYVAAGGIAVGLVVGYLLAEIRKRLDDPMTEATMSLFSGYAAFLPADQLGLSGVLADRRLRPLPRLPRARTGRARRPACRR